MADALPRLRLNLDFLPSTDREKPGLFIRDPYGYSDATLLIPPPLVQVLECFDGVQSPVDLRSELVRITGQIQTSDLETHLFDSLDEAGFLENDRYRDLKSARETSFAAEPVRSAHFAGSAYPENHVQLSQLLQARVGQPVGNSRTIGIAAPHASPDGGWSSYRAAYRALPPTEVGRDCTFVILGTSHYGAPDRFGLTRKPYVTPFGTARTNAALVEELAAAAPGAVRMEDYCHAVEHSIEFQVVFLQSLYGPDISILPVLCGPFVKSLYEGGRPEENQHVARFLDALGNMAAREGRRVFWILGVDMAHMGRRYGDPLRAKANLGEMMAIEERDRQRIAQITAGDHREFWPLVQENHDDLKWCGSSPFYTFLHALPNLKGELLEYQQWQIDPESVVTFGALRFE